MIRSLWFLALTILATLQCVADAAETVPATTERSQTIALSSCQVSGMAQPARCGVLEVPENPDLPQGRRLPIHLMVVPALHTPALADPIVVLMGGPGEEALSGAAYWANQFAQLRDDRDLLLVDQRGAGRSAALQCDLYAANDPAASLRDLFPLAAVKRCEEKLRARADLTQYTYPHFADDLEHVRRALGYGSLNLYAGSYGTRAAQVYIRTYPGSVRTAYLGSVVPIDMPMPLPNAKTAQEALDTTFSACAADADCRAAFPNLRDEFRRAMTRLESGTVRVTVAGLVKGAPLSRGRVAEWFRARLYRPSSATELPWLIHQAFQGDWTPIAQGILSDAPTYDSGLSFGLLFAITCSDDVAFIREQEVVPATEGTFLGAYRVRQQQAACEIWPKVAMPPDYRKPVHSAVPTLFVSGDADGGTPLRFTEHVAQGFSNSVQVVLRNQGHTEWSGCVGEIYERFVRSGSVKGLSTSCEPAQRPPFRTH